MPVSTGKKSKKDSDSENPPNEGDTKEDEVNQTHNV